jgi:predicted metal-binding protein
MAGRLSLEKMFRDHGFDNFTWIDPGKIIVAQWVRVKCMYGCDDYGRNAACPPNVPSVTECRELFGEYSSGVAFHFEVGFDDPKERHAWVAGVNRRLFELERKVFISGYEKAFMLFVGCCQLCSDCPPDRTDCKQPEKGRPSPEAFAIDVFSTVGQYGLPIEVLANYAEAMNRYAFLLVE